jgi:hypothetical protein
VIGLDEKEGDEAEEGKIKFKGAHGEAFPVGPYVIKIFDRLGLSQAACKFSVVESQALRPLRG